MKFYKLLIPRGGTWWRSCLRHYDTSRKVAGSNPGWGGFFNSPNPSSHHYGPGVYSASNRNEYQDSSWGVKGGGSIRLTTSLPSLNRMSGNIRASTSHSSKGLRGLYRDSFTFHYIFLKLRYVSLYIYIHIYIYTNNFEEILKRFERTSTQVCKKISGCSPIHPFPLGKILTGFMVSVSARISVHTKKTGNCRASKKLDLKFSL
jgi:hypothetical protein